MGIEPPKTYDEDRENDRDGEQGDACGRPRPRGNDRLDLIALLSFWVISEHQPRQKAERDDERDVSILIWKDPAERGVTEIEAGCGDESLLRDPVWLLSCISGGHVGSLSNPDTRDLTQVLRLRHQYTI